MATLRSKDFFDTPEGQEIQAMLQLMDNSTEYVTAATYSPKSETYSTNSMSFVEKHMAYLLSHPNLDAGQYVSNLRIMSRKTS